MELSNLIVVCDNMDLRPGCVRLKSSGSSGGQKGLESIINRVGTKEFSRLFIGIGRPEFGGEVVTHVLSRPSKLEAEAIATAMEFCADQIISLLETPFAKVATQINSYKKNEI